MMAGKLSNWVEPDEQLAEMRENLLNARKYLETDKLMPISQYTDFTRLENGMAEVDALWLISDGNPNQGKRNVKLSPDQPLNVIATGDTV